jgi:type II secretory ATPase GspE/PulE/Tfp pilus assembly ATPase PilB-like protein
MSEDEKRRAEALRLGVPFVTLTRDDISIESLIFIPEPLSRTANIVAYRHGEEGVEVALLDLADLPQIDFLRQTHRVQVRLTDRGSIKQALLLYQKHLKEKFAGMIAGGKEAAESLLKHALHSGAHYVHLEPATVEATGMVVRYRIEGVLREAMRLPEEASRYIVERIKSLAKLFPVSTTAQEGSFDFEHEGRKVGVAVTATPTANGERLSMRLAHDTQSVTGFSLTSLGLHGDALEKVHNALQKQKGIIVVAGMDDSGKTTMLYTMLDHVTGVHKSVATVEESVEFRLPRVHQTATRPDLGLTIAAALRAVLKQDPDTVMVSILDDESALRLAGAAAERGICILGGVTARSTANAIDIVPDAELVVAQRLMRRLKPKAATRPLSRAEAEVLEGKMRFAKVLAALKAENIVEGHTAWKDITFYTGDAASYQGQVGVQEVIAKGVKEEGLTMLEDALFKAVQGLVSIEDVVEMAAE